MCTASISPHFPAATGSRSREIRLPKVLTHLVGQLRDTRSRPLAFKTKTSIQTFLLYRPTYSLTPYNTTAPPAPALMRSKASTNQICILTNAPVDYAYLIQPYTFPIPLHTKKTLKYEYYDNLSHITKRSIDKVLESSYNYYFGLLILRKNYVYQAKTQMHLVVSIDVIVGSLMLTIWEPINFAL